MPDTKKNPVEEEHKEHKGSCNSEKPQTCDSEKEEKSKSSSWNDKSAAEKSTEHKHGGNCNH